MSLKLFLPILILIPLAALILILKPGLSQNSATNDPPKSALAPDSLLPTPNSAITVDIKFLPSQSNAQTFAFEVSLNTHSIDLEDIDFQKSVILEKSGQKFSPVEVKTEGAGHHRSAEVKFNRVSAPLKIIFSETPEVARQEFMFDELK